MTETDFIGAAETGERQHTDEKLLTVKDLSVSFGTEDGTVRAVREVSFSLGSR